jgi:hypothetical protein
MTALGSEKAAILRRIDASRTRSVEAASRVVRPMERIDQTLVRWRWLSPIITSGALSIGSLLLKRWLASPKHRRQRHRP